MSIFSNVLLEEFQIKDENVLIGEINDIVSENFEYNNIFCSVICNESLVFLNESKFMDTIKSIFDRIKEGIKKAIKKIKDLFMSLINKIRGVKKDKESKDNKDIKDMEEKQKKADNISEEEAEKLKEDNEDGDSTSGNIKFIENKVYSGYVDQNPINEILAPIPKGEMSANFNSYFDVNLTIIKLDSRKGIASFTNPYRIPYKEEKLKTPFPICVHLEPELVSDKKLNLDEYKKVLNDKLSVLLSKGINIYSKDVCKYLESGVKKEKQINRYKRWANDVISAHQEILSNVEKIEKELDEMIKNNKNSYSKTEKINNYGSTEEKTATVDTKEYFKYVSDVSKFISYLISGFSFLLSKITYCTNFFQSQNKKLMIFYRSCFIYS